MGQTTVLIGGKHVGPGNPCFIIAEAGVNHNGDLATAKELVRAAKRAGADCVKFQTFTADRIITDNAPKANYQLKTTDPKESQKEMLKKLELPHDAYPELLRTCQEEGIVFMSTPSKRIITSPWFIGAYLSKKEATRQCSSPSTNPFHGGTLTAYEKTLLLT
jgi:sialic acid synthase SpsE